MTSPSETLTIAPIGACKIHPTRERYARMRMDGKTWAMHRFAWTWLHGPIPAGRVIHHTCGNSRCLNPDHLEAITEREHLAERHGQIHAARGVSVANRLARTHCKRGHELTPENIVPGVGHRRCRLCNNLRSREWLRSRSAR